MHEWPHIISGTDMKGWGTSGTSHNLGYLSVIVSIPSLCNYDTTWRADDYQLEKKYYVSWFTKMGWMRQIYTGGILF